MAVFQLCDKVELFRPVNIIAAHMLSDTIVFVVVGKIKKVTSELLAAFKAAFFNHEVMLECVLC